MNSTGADADGSRGAFSPDTTVPGAPARGFDAFLRGWETQVGDGFPLRAFRPATTGDFRVKARAARVHDAAIADLHVTSAIRTARAHNRAEDQVRRSSRPGPGRRGDRADTSGSPDARADRC